MASRAVDTIDTGPSFVQADADALTALSARLFASAPAREGMTAFLERRDPEWAV